MGATKKANCSGGFAAPLLSGCISDAFPYCDRWGKLVDSFMTSLLFHVTAMLLRPSFTALQIKRMLIDTTIWYINIFHLMFVVMGTLIRLSSKLQVGPKELLIRRMVGGFPQGMYPMGGPQLIIRM
jgi:hypothetical protein